MKQIISTKDDKVFKKLEEIAIEGLCSVIDNGGTFLDYYRRINYIKSHAIYPNKEIRDKITKYSNKG